MVVLNELTHHLERGQAHPLHEPGPFLPRLPRRGPLCRDGKEGADANLFDEEGEPIAWPVAVAGDKGYRADWIDEYLLDLGINPVIPSKNNEDRDARPVEFNRDAYKERNIVERLIGWLKENRRIFSRFEKTAKNFGGFLKMAFIHRYLMLAII